MLERRGVAGSLRGAFGKVRRRGRGRESSRRGSDGCSARRGSAEIWPEDELRTLLAERLFRVLRAGELGELGGEGEGRTVVDPAGEGGEAALFFECETLDVRRGFDDLLPDLDGANEPIDLEAKRLELLRPARIS